jgi:hypothetical protein
MSWLFALFGFGHRLANLKLSDSPRSHARAVDCRSRPASKGYSVCGGPGVPRLHHPGIVFGDQIARLKKAATTASVKSRSLIANTSVQTRANNVQFRFAHGSLETE